MDRWPHLAGTLLDLPEVMVHAEPILAAHGDPGRIAFEPGEHLQRPRRRTRTTWRCCGRSSRSWTATPPAARFATSPPA